MRASRHWFKVVVLGLGVAAAAALVNPAAAQVDPQDGIDRNLQQRAVREQEFHVGLEESIPIPRPYVPGKSGLQIYVPTPGSEILQRDKPLPAPQQPRVAPGKSVVGGDVLLQDSQRRRELELQTQLQNQSGPGSAADAARQQMLQIQQLQFNRETSSQDLGSKIMRDSQRALGAPH